MGSESLCIWLNVTQSSSGRLRFELWNSGSQRTCCSPLFYTVPEVVGSQEMGVVEAGMAEGKHGLKTEMGTHRSQHPNLAS